MCLSDYLHFINVAISVISSICLVCFSYTTYITSERKRQDDLFKIRYEFIKELECELITFDKEYLCVRELCNIKLYKTVPQTKRPYFINKTKFLFDKKIAEVVKEILNENLNKKFEEYINISEDKNGIAHYGNDKFYKLFEKYLKLEN